MSEEVLPVSDDKQKWIEQAEEHIIALLRAHYGNVILEHNEKDLQLAQQLVTDKIVGKSDILELQCLGVILGNVFAAQTSMKWATVSNEYGSMLALHSAQFGFTLYPLTMISQRIEQRRKVDIPNLYRTFVNELGLSTG